MSSVAEDFPVVDRADTAFKEFAKPTGSPMDEVTARKRAADLGWQVKEDSGRGWRRMVPSPRPKSIVDLVVISRLVDADYVVIACGGVGISLIEDEQGDVCGIETEIDKDFASTHPFLAIRL